MRRDKVGRSGCDTMAYHLSRMVAFPYFLLMHSLRWYGVENVPDSGPAIIAANHQSYYDPVVISLGVSRTVTYMGWDKFFRWPILGSLMRLYGVIPVNVDAPGPSSYAGMVRALKGGEACGIFPEGGRTPDGLLRRPRPGVGALALETGAPVVPVTIDGAYHAWPPGRGLPRPAPIRLLFGEPMTFRAGEDRADIALAVMHRIADGFEELARPVLSRTAHQRLDGQPSGDIQDTVKRPSR